MTKSIETNWIAITGAPCSGKTTVIDRLSEMGHLCVPEASRTFINGLIEAGISREERMKMRRSYQPDILGMRVTAEETADRSALTFFDRATPDSLMYFRYHEIPIDPIQRQMEKYRYKQVFLFARLPFEADAVRLEDDARAAEMELELLESYQFFGYEPIIVPVLPVEERIRFIFDHIA